jgi:protein-disulfide isomerase
MSSRADEKARRRQERLAREHAQRAAEQRRRRLWQLGAVTAFAAVLVAAAVLISQAGSGPSNAGGDDELVADARAVDALFAKIPQDGVFLGDPDAPVTLVKFVDLQCPFCAQFARDALPTVVERYVRTGRVRLQLQPLTFIGPDSERAGRLAAAAAQQDRLWQFSELFFRNQGIENTGYVTDEFLGRLARATPGLDAQQALASTDDPVTAQLLARAKLAATRNGITSTPSFLIGRGGQVPQRLEPARLTAEAFTTALDEALAS